MPRYFFLAYRNVIRHRRRSAFSVLVVGFGVAAIMLSTGFIEWNLEFGRESTIRSQLGHIKIVRPGYLDGGIADPFAYLLPGQGEDFHAIQMHPHVRSLAPRLAFQGLISLGDSTISFVGEGVDPAREVSLSEAVTITSGSGLSGDDSRGIIVGQGLAANLGVALGDTVVLMGTTGAGGANAVEGTVRGTFSTIAKAYDDSAIRVPLPMAQQLLRVQGAHSWVALLDATENTDRVLRTLRTTFADRALEFVPWTAMADFYNKTAALFAKQVGVIKIIIATIIVMSISNTLIMSVFERTGEIGTSMALGADRLETLRMFLAEGLLLGAAGSAGGVVVGYVLALLISEIGIPMPPGPGMAHGFVAGITITWQLALQAFAIGLVTTICASSYPAWRASRLAIVDALRHNR